VGEGGSRPVITGSLKRSRNRDRIPSSFWGALRIPKVVQRICDGDLRDLRDLETEMKKGICEKVKKRWSGDLS
jgi:hypothetical protein